MRNHHCSFKINPFNVVTFGYKQNILFIVTYKYERL